MRNWLKRLFCWHKYTISYRFGDGCEKCGNYRDNVWY